MRPGRGVSRPGRAVVATIRGARRTALHDLLPVAGGRLEIEPVDIGEPGQILGLHDRLAGRTFDLLFVDAGVTNGPDETVADVTDAEFTRLMVINALSPMRVIERLREFVAADGTIAIMSSGQGSIANNEGGGFEIFRASKSALNQLMRSYAARRRDDTRTLLRTGARVDQEHRGGWSRRSLDHRGEHPPTRHGHRRATGPHFLDRRGRTISW